MNKTEVSWWDVKPYSINQLVHTMKYYYFLITPRQFLQLSLCEVHACLLCLILQYADPVADLIDKWGIFHARLFRDSCIFHRGSFVKVG